MTMRAVWRVWHAPGLTVLTWCLQKAFQLACWGFALLAGVLRAAGPSTRPPPQRKKSSRAGRASTRGGRSAAAQRASPRKLTREEGSSRASGLAGASPRHASAAPKAGAQGSLAAAAAAANQAAARWPHPEGYNAAAEELLSTEFKRLEGKVYVDYAGAPPYAASVLRQATEELLSSLHGNPHSAYGWAEHASEVAAERVRQATLAMCHADPQHYECVLTPGATGALKLLAESYPWGPSSAFLHLRDNHNSVLGMRQVAARAGATSTAVEISGFDPSALGMPSGGPAGPAGAPRALELSMCSLGSSSGGVPVAGLVGLWEAVGRREEEEAGEVPNGAPQHLFALPLESNLWGVRYDEMIVEAVQAGSFALGPAGAQGGWQAPLPGRWRVLLDAAKGCASCPPNLSRHPADFVALSFYKIFGYPTGVGALIVRRDALGCLLCSKAYFGGGTVEVSLAEQAFFRRRSGAAGLEDGTPPFLQLPSILQGFDFIQRCGGFPAISSHALAVARSLAERLSQARHANGAPLCVVYGAWPGGQGLLHTGAGQGGPQVVAGPSGVEGSRAAAEEGFAAGAEDQRALEGAQQGTGQSAAQHGERGESPRHAQHGQHTPQQVEAAEAMQQALARHKALQRTNVLWHSRRRKVRFKGAQPSEPSGSSALASTVASRAASSSWGDESPRSSLGGSTPHTPAGQDLEGASGPEPALQPLLEEAPSSSGGGGAVARPESACGEATPRFSTPSSSRQRRGSGSAACDSAAGAAAAAQEGVAELGLGSGSGDSSGSGGSGEKHELPCDCGKPGEHGGPCGAATGQADELLRRCGVARQGPVVAFNVLRPDGSYVGYREVEKLGSLHAIFLRTGCMCNPGACAQALGLTPEEVKANYKGGHVCWDDHDVINGKPTGVVRASFGYASTLADADAIVTFLEHYFLEGSTGCTGHEGQQPQASTPAHQAEDFAAPAGTAAAAAQINGSPVAAQAPASNPCVAPNSPPAALPPWPNSTTTTTTVAASQQQPVAPLDQALPVWADSGSGALPTVTPPPPPLITPGSRAGQCAAPRQVPGGPPQLWQPPGQLGGIHEDRSGMLRVEAIFVYPIKSCRGMRAEAWPLGPTGLLYDRHWVLVDGSGSALTLRRCPALATIQPAIDLERRVLRVSTDRMPGILELQLPEAGSGLGSSCGAGALSIRVCSRQACAQSAATLSGDEEFVGAWFQRALGVPCRLVQQVEMARSGRGGGGGAKASRDLGAAGSAQYSMQRDVLQREQELAAGPPASPRSFANEGQLLVVGSASLADLYARSAGELAARAAAAPEAHESSDCSQAAATQPREEMQAFALRFRPNLVVGSPGAAPFLEDQWSRVTLAGVALRSAGGCPRCDMVCADPYTGRRSGPEPLLSLAGYRRQRGPGGGGKICFGILLNQECPKTGDGTKGVGSEQQEEARPGSGLAMGQELRRLAGEYERQLAVGMAVHAE